ncbi:MAG: hypothetical protein QXZ22_07275 [Sulfolobales archaeon]
MRAIIGFLVDLWVDSFNSDAAGLAFERLRKLREKILNWFKRHGRRFPWRGEVGWYGVLVAEFMLIRTRSEVAEKLFEEFIRIYPKPELICSSNPEDVTKYFRKIGLPTRAKRLIDTVCIILSEYSGEVPCDYRKLRELPGVGDYIARVLLSRVCGKHYAFVDSNIIRVLSRFSGKLLSTMEAAQILEKAFTSEDLTTINVALLDLGSLVCKPKKPYCLECPINELCQYYVTSQTSFQYFN